MWSLVLLLLGLAIKGKAAIVLVISGNVPFDRTQMFCGFLLLRHCVCIPNVQTKSCGMCCSLIANEAFLHVCAGHADTCPVISAAGGTLPLTPDTGKTLSVGNNFACYVTRTAGAISDATMLQGNVCICSLCSCFGTDTLGSVSNAPTTTGFVSVSAYLDHACKMLRIMQQSAC